MQLEKEIKILNIQVPEVERQLEMLGAVCKGTFFQKRYTYDIDPTNPNKWMRLRTNGEKSTLAIKEIVDKNKVDGVKEWEIKVSDFEETKNILFELGYKHRNYQENTRTVYEFENLEITIDKWPFIPAYLEIEGQKVEDVVDMVNKLKLQNCETTTEDVVSVYEKYGYNILAMKELKEN